MSGRRSRDKGANGEREGAKELVRLYALHGLTAKAQRTAPLQAGGRRDLLPPDVSAADVTCDLLPDYHLEWKRQEDVRMTEWCAQAARDCGARKWAVVWRQNRQPWRVTLPLHNLVRLPGSWVPELVTLSLADFVSVRVRLDGRA